MSLAIYHFSNQQTLQQGLVTTDKNSGQLPKDQEVGLALKRTELELVT